MNSINAWKNFANRALLCGVLATAIAFFYAVSLPKKYLVEGNVVVFPSGLGTARENLSLETGNTEQILKGATFRERYFRENMLAFKGAVRTENSSTISVAFHSEEKNIAEIEDLIVKIPSYLSEYTRDIYEGAPFRYKLLGDPEVSAGPAKPELVQYLFWGFASGIALYLVYWILFDFLRISTQKTGFQNEKILNKMEDMREEKISETEKRVPEQEEREASVPENLPVMESDDGKNATDSDEPSDEEVKERLNRLMRGEL